jgi:sulfur carrier protein ThiS
MGTETMRVTILPDRQVREVEARTVADLLKELGLRRDAHLVVRGEDILTSDVRLGRGDDVEVWPVISGGASASGSRTHTLGRSPCLRSDRGLSMGVR